MMKRGRAKWCGAAPRYGGPSEKACPPHVRPIHQKRRVCGRTSDLFAWHSPPHFVCFFSSGRASALRIIRSISHAMLVCAYAHAFGGHLLPEVGKVEVLLDLEARGANHGEVLRDGGRAGGAVAVEVETHELSLLGVVRVPPLYTTAENTPRSAGFMSRGASKALQSGADMVGTQVLWCNLRR